MLETLLLLLLLVLAYGIGYKHRENVELVQELRAKINATVDHIVKPAGADTKGAIVIDPDDPEQMARLELKQRMKAIERLNDQSQLH